MRVLHFLLMFLIIAVIMITSILFYKPTFIYDIKDEKKIIVKIEDNKDDETLKLFENIAKDEKEKIALRKRKEMQVKRKLEIEKQLNKELERQKLEKSFDGEALYIKQCKLCHGDEENFANQFSINMWNKIFKNDGKALAKQHDVVTVTRYTNNYFKTKEYKLQVYSLKNHIISNIKEY